MSQQVAVQRYSVYVVQDIYLNGAPWSVEEYQSKETFYISGNTVEQNPSDEFNLAIELMSLYDTRNRLAYLINSACIQAYSSPLQTERGSLLVQSPDTSEW